MSLSLKQINDKLVKKIYIPDDDTRPVKGYDICQEVYSNIFLCARKKSGKTCALFKIIKECAVKDTVIIVFCSTIYKDKNWIQIRKYFEKKGMDIRVYTSIYEDGEDQLSTLIHDLSAEAKEKEEIKDEDETQEEPSSADRCDDILQRLASMHLQTNSFPAAESDEKEKKKKVKKCKYQAPEYIIIFDDLSSELKSSSLLRLMKFNRHFKTKLIISSQWLHDLLPESRKQFDVFLIFKGFPLKKCELIYRDCDIAIPFEIFYKIYKKATKKPFSFMYIDTRSDSFRCNFNQEFIIHSKEDDNDSET